MSVNKKNVNLQHNYVPVSTAVATAVDTADTEVDTASLSVETQRSTLRLTDLADMDMVDMAADTVNTAVDTVDMAVDTVDTAVDILMDTALTSDTDTVATDTKYLLSSNGLAYGKYLPNSNRRQHACKYM